ncbi:MAG TPA: acetate kinase [Sulfurospirillum sp. UBA12182]|jgi:acetate kinase|nr:MAG TPA: acetate kinase [Sulfurospirillum sp. UBA12182]
MKILVLNSGSSSVKFQVFEDDISFVSGLIEQIGEENSAISIILRDEKVVDKQIEIKSHFDGLQIAANYLLELGVVKDLNEFDGIGHRVVHGGEYFNKAMLVTDDVIEKIESLQPLAPLHNPAHLDGIRVTKKLNPLVPNVVVFDTAFHQSIPAHAYMYALPYKFYEEDGVRKYGFHGTSHHFVAKVAARMLQKDINSLNAITLHLGNGGSVTAIENGKSIDTSMGLTPLEGLIMGTRSGDLDPAILFYLSRKKGYDINELDKILNKQSGLKGICGANDMREIHSMAESGDKKAQLALDMFYYRIKKYIGSYSAILGRVDCIVFTGGIGENDDIARLESCHNLENLGIKLNVEENALRKKVAREISSDDSLVKVFVIPTNEELEIALQTQEVVKNSR